MKITKVIINTCSVQFFPCVLIVKEYLKVLGIKSVMIHDCSLSYCILRTSTEIAEKGCLYICLINKTKTNESNIYKEDVTTDKTKKYFTGHLLYVKQESKSTKIIYPLIILHPDLIDDTNKSVIQTLKHELIHLKYSRHCGNKNCSFNKNGGHTTFCNKCRVKLLKTIKEKFK